MINPNKIFVFNTKKDAETFAVKKWTAISTQAVRQRDRFTVALSGGCTPKDFYKKLRTHSNLPWDKTHIFLVDERYVPYEDEASNFGSIKESLIQHINIPEGNIHPISTAEDNSEAVARKYEADLKAFFDLGKDEFPGLDLIMLGIGEDGHTASLFAGTKELREDKRLAVSVSAKKPPNERISITLPVINHAENVIFLVTGKNKARIIKEIMGGNNAELPAALVKPESGEVSFILDKDAASLISGLGA